MCPRARRASASRWSNELGTPPTLHNSLRRLRRLISFPVARWLAVGRIENRPFEERIIHARSITPVVRCSDRRQSMCQAPCSIGISLFPVDGPPNRTSHMDHCYYRLAEETVSACQISVGAYAPQLHHRHPSNSFHLSARNTASGSDTSTMSSTAAGPDGCRLPCSQFCSVLTLTPTSLANTRWERPIALHMASTRGAQNTRAPAKRLALFLPAMP